MRETWEEACGKAIHHKLYCLFDLPHIGQIHVMYLAHLAEGVYGVGTESLECQLFDIADIPWDTLSFRTVEVTLRRYVADLANFGACLSDYPLHEITLPDAKNT